MFQASLVAQGLSPCLWLSHCSLVMAICGPKKSSLVAAKSIIPEHIWVYWGPERLLESSRCPYTLQGRRILLSVFLWQQKGPRLADTRESSSFLFRLPKSPFWKEGWLLGGKFVHLCSFWLGLVSDLVLYCCHFWWLLLQNVVCPPHFHSWMFVCWWQRAEEGVTCGELHCATGKYLEGSATARFNSCYSPSCSKYFSSVCCYREFQDYTASHCALWLVSSARCPHGEVFWVFRTHMFPHFITGIHMAFY